MSTIKYFLKGQGKCQFSQELIDEIKKINPIVLMTQEEQIELRNKELLKELTEFTKKFGQVSVPQKYSGNGSIHLGSQISEIKRFLRGNTRHKSYTQDLIDKILKINPNVLNISEITSNNDDENETE